MCEPLARGSIGAAREHAVQVLAVLRHDVDAARPKTLDVEDGQDQKRAPDLLRVEPQQPQRGFDRAELRTVHACRDEKARAGLRPFQHSERDLEALDRVTESLLTTDAAGVEFGEVSHENTFETTLFYVVRTLSPAASLRQRDGERHVSAKPARNLSRTAIAAMAPTVLAIQPLIPRAFIWPPIATCRFGSEPAQRPAAPETVSDSRKEA